MAQENAPTMYTTNVYGVSTHMLLSYLPQSHVTESSVSLIYYKSCI